MVLELRKLLQNRLPEKDFIRNLKGVGGKLLTQLLRSFVSMFIMQGKANDRGLFSVGARHPPFIRDLLQFRPIVHL